MLIKIKVDISCYRDSDYIVNFDWRVYETKKKNLLCKAKEYCFKLNRSYKKILHINLFFNIYFNLKTLLKKKDGDHITC